jgi:hypothetical protein
MGVDLINSTPLFANITAKCSYFGGVRLKQEVRNCSPLVGGDMLVGIAGAGRLKEAS